MAVQTLYEVHTLKSGNWAVDSTYPDRDTAIDVAKSLHGEKQFQAVKVIKDTFDEATGNGKEIVVFDTTSKVNSDKTPPPAPAPEKPATAAAASGATGTCPACKREEHEGSLCDGRRGPPVAGSLCPEW